MGLSIKDLNTIGNVINKKKGEWLSYNGKDEIVTVQSFGGKFFYVISDIARFYCHNQHYRNVKRIIKNTLERLNAYLESPLIKLENIKAMEITIDRFLDSLDKFNRFNRNKKIAFAIDKTRKAFNQSVLSCLSEKDKLWKREAFSIEEHCSLVYKIIMRSPEVIENNSSILTLSKFLIKKITTKDLDELKMKYSHLKMISRLLEVFDHPDIAEARRGLDLYKARLSGEGKCHAYFLFNRRGEKIAIFKSAKESNISRYRDSSNSLVL